MIGAMPIFVAGLSAIIFRERFTWRQIAGFASVIMGIGCVGGQSLFLGRISGGEWRGDLLFLVCGFLFAAFTLAQRRSGITAWHAAALVNVISFIGFSPIYLILLHSNIFAASLAEVTIQLIAQGSAAVLGLFFYGVAVRSLGASRAAVFAALAPGISALLEMPILGEMPSVVTLFGVVLVSVGVTLVVDVAWSRERRG
jgi:drug/metabolite transporter (DMT)-like permease